MLLHMQGSLSRRAHHRPDAKTRVKATDGLNGGLHVLDQVHHHQINPLKRSL